MNRMHIHSAQTAVAVVLAHALASAVYAQAQVEQHPIPEIIVTAPYGIGIDAADVPSSVQLVTADDIQRLHVMDVTELLNRSFSGVNINHAQNNPLQPDVNFRGFTASPLLGLPQGLAVYQDGVRINEPFGDTVNWDLIPLSAIQSVQMLGGAHPVFGLNSLGGALSFRMKTGFDYQGTGIEAHGGSFGRIVASLQHGGHNDSFGYYANVDYFEEDGWRDYSKSEAIRFFGVVSWRNDESSQLDLSLSMGDTKLRGNGASPAELLAIDRKQVFTHPDITENSQVQLILSGQHALSSSLVLAGNAYYRDIDTDSFNGDGTVFEECEFGDDEFLVEDFVDLNGDGECSADDDDAIEVAFDMAGNPIPAEMDGEELNAINNISRRRQDSYGGSLQLSWSTQLAGRANDLLVGIAFQEGRATFHSMTEVARLLENRSTSRTGIFVEEFLTDVKSEVSVASAYFTNRLALTDRAHLTVSGRFDTTRIRLNDRTGASPELDGRHRFERFNPALGFTYRLGQATTLYANVGESTRTPTPVELACASADAPCNLPNAFLADPPLDEVVARTAELGLRGRAQNGMRWNIGAFYTLNRDDILFQTTGGAQANVGFFDNVGDTRRVGIELGVAQQFERFRWSFDYSLVDATFEDSFAVNSPNHPIFEEDEDAPQIVGEGALQVPSGATIPGIPKHQANFAADFFVTRGFVIGGDLLYRSGVYLRGDEPNLLGKTDDYVVLNLHGEYRFSNHMTVYARVENVLDEEYETFGLLGEPDEVFPEFDDPRFFGAGPPRGAWLGFRVRF